MYTTIIFLDLYLYVLDPEDGKNLIDLSMYWVQRGSLSDLGFNSRDPGSILGRDISRDILKNPGISRFDFSLIKM